uniref:Uncharacterized protein n=1 Tax=Anguilla anguilla TaxID=7936 RepID=A0A0E9W4W8_ANGAN
MLISDQCPEDHGKHVPVSHC